MNVKKTLRGAIVVASATAIAASGLLVNPAPAATKTTVVWTEPTPLTSLNPSATNMNLNTNLDVVYPTGFGFWYANNQQQLVPNSKFGSYRISKNSTTDFQVTYTVNPGQVWNDGVPITAVDLLLSHVLSSSVYSKAAGLGDPSAKGVTPAFDSLGYGAVYDSNVNGDPVLSADKMSLVVKYTSKIPDWDQYAPSPFPVHALEMLAAGKTALPSKADGQAMTDKFLSDFTTKNTASLKAMGTVWTKSYNITKVDSSTNPLLLVGNGDYKITSCIDKISCTLELDSTNGQSGPKASIAKIVARFDVSDTSAPQALGNKEIDLYQGQPTADAVAGLKQVKGIDLISAPVTTWEQISLRVDAATHDGSYKGPFAGQSGKGLATRQAFLLALPREDMVDKLIKPVQSDAVVLNSRFYMPSQGSLYTAQVAVNGSNYYSGDYATRAARALSIMKQNYGADVLSKPVTINVLHRNNARRNAEFALYKAALAKVGFNLIDGGGRADWSSHLSDTTYDAAFFAWGNGLPIQDGDCQNEATTGGNNAAGWSNSIIDSNCKMLQASAVSDAKKKNAWIAIERAFNASAYGAGLFQWPGVTAVNSDLKNVKPSPITPNLVWNYWEWTY